MPSAVSALLAARVDPNQTSNMSSTPALMEAALKVYVYIDSQNSYSVMNE